MGVYSTSAVVDTLMVVESLPDGHAHTGKQLENDLASINRLDKRRTAFKTVGSSIEFFEVLEALHRRAVVDRWRPILHLEIHGLSGAGLKLEPSGEFITWMGLVDACRPINEATGNNLIVVLAACSSYEAILSVQWRELTPFSYLIAPATEVATADIMDSFPRFYRTLFESLSIDEARKHLPAQYCNYNAEEMFVRSYANYIVQSCTSQARQERAEEILTGVLDHVPYADKKKTRKEAKRKLVPTAADFERFHRRFLLSDLPQNRGRFACTFADLMAQVRQEPGGWRIADRMRRF